MSYQDFKNRVLGKGFDIDRSFGNQCWDGYAYYCQYLGVPYANCTVTGYVRDIWEQRAKNGMLNHFDETPLMVAGDIAVFKISNATPYSHVAIFDSDAGNGYGWFLGQNQGAPNGVFNLVKLPYSATYDTAFRKKGSSQPKRKIGIKAHFQDIGWQREIWDDCIEDLKGRRLEAFQVFSADGTVFQSVQVHVQNKGWLPVSKNPSATTIHGTVGQSLRLEAVKIKTSKPCTVRVKFENGQWSDYVECDGVSVCGTTGQSKKLVGIEIKRK